MLKGKSKEELHEFLETKLAERLPFYAKADFSIDTNVPKSPDKIVKTLLDITKQFESQIELNIQLQQQQ